MREAEASRLQPSCVEDSMLRTLIMLTSRADDVYHLLCLVIRTEQPRSDLNTLNAGVFLQLGFL